jgi:hypothetical protein
MRLKKDIKKVFIVLMAAFMLLGGFSTKAYAVEKKQATSETQKEYEKWKIMNKNGVYFYKQRSVRLLVDDAGDKAVTNNFFFRKSGKVDIQVIRNKEGKIKKIKYISKKRAEEIIKNYNTAFYIKNK